MNNFKSAVLFAAGSLSALSICVGLPAHAQVATPLAASAAVSAPAPGSASVDPSKMSVAQFTAQYHVAVVQDAAPMVSLPLDSAPPTARLDALQQLAAGSGMTWRKIYRVSPATADNPATTLSSAQNMVDQPAQVSLSAAGIPESLAFKTVAAADNATIDYTGGAVAQDVSVNLAGSTLPQAIASLALQSHTHWEAVYLLAPVSGSSAPPAQMAYAAHPRLAQEQQGATQYDNGPFTIHFADPPQSTAVASAAATSSPVSATATSAQPQNGLPVNPAAPSPGIGGYSAPYQFNPYGPFGSADPDDYARPSLMSVGNSILSTPYSVYGDNY